MRTYLPTTVAVPPGSWSDFDVVRLNFSHGTHEQHANALRLVREAAAAAGRHVAVLQDLSGPKIRTGRLAGGAAIPLPAGSRLRITTGDGEGVAGHVYQYLGPPDEDVDLGAVDYTDTDFWTDLTVQTSLADYYPGIGNLTDSDAHAVGILIVMNDLRANAPGLLVGGGSGHEPVYHGLVGRNLADGAACGDIFAAPPPDIILDGTRAVHRGKGVLYLYGNYAGDVLNFDMAAELAGEEGIEVKTVLIWDDVASAPPTQKENRRGIAGLVLIVKVAGAAAAGRVHSSDDRVFTSTNTRQSSSRKIRSISPRSDRKFAVRNFSPRFWRCFFAARSPSSPRRKCSGFSFPPRSNLMRPMKLMSL